MDFRLPKNADVSRITGTSYRLRGRPAKSKDGNGSGASRSKIFLSDVSLRVN